MKIDVINQQGEKIASIKIKDISKPKLDIKSVLVNLATAQRQNTKAAKSRGQVKGSNKKPWRQKGTGRARAGSVKSPLWRGGGVTFAPQPIARKIKLNKKVKQQAVKNLIYLLAKEKNLFVINKFHLKTPQTSLVANLFKKINVNKKILVASFKEIKNLKKSVRNIPFANYFSGNSFSALDVAKSKYMLITKKALQKIVKINL
ncbi:MAG: large subunit ribosomal protein L4 [Candidatus Berkelbacteria bacterium Licking1014_7]|uniref:Large ribosomal subunit protein uL4 n=1 Tax=Candidatus Berkelbacteria bacterium Licking1014_7 TaxID=2017147 RepID=A0A554LKJ1_9BACT|nr:MAG: large subunit ribosomal protein L4 [Candidatus Berkelbacteria bacterium Licking1014_7]